MNYQDVNSCRRRCIRCICPASVIGFFALLLAFAIGLILGAIYYETILPALAAIIAFAAAIAAGVIGLLIYCWCKRCE